MPDTFFTRTYAWYGCDTCKKYYALTERQRFESDERMCPQGHDMFNGRMLSKQWQELTGLWAIYTALYFDRDKDEMPWISYAQLAMVARFQREMKEQS